MAGALVALGDERRGEVEARDGNRLKLGVELLLELAAV